MPLFLRHPDSLTGRRIFKPLVSLTDISPTLLEWFELLVPAEFEGCSLLALTDEWRKRAFPARNLVGVGGGTGNLPWSLRTAHQRLIALPETADGPALIRLYDLSRVAGSTRDVAHERPQEVERLLHLLRAELSAAPLTAAVKQRLWF